MCYTTDNTEGYTKAELVVLNAEFHHRAGDLDPDNDDMSYLSNRKHIAERVLADYDTGKWKPAVDPCVEMIGAVWADDGPTGDYAEVLEVAVVDYGDNEHGRAGTIEGLDALRAGLRIQTQVKVTQAGGLVGREYVTSDRDCSGIVHVSEVRR